MKTVIKDNFTLMKLALNHESGYFTIEINGVKNAKDKCRCFGKNESLMTKSFLRVFFLQK